MELNSEENKGENRRRRRRVGLIHDERMCKHFTPDDDYHPENPNRILAIWNKLKSSGITQRCVVLSAKEAQDKYIAAVHTKNHIDLIKNISSKKFDSRREKIAGKYNSIYFNEGSSEAAYLAAGSVVEVAERVAKGDLDSAFAIVRPPGHHAEENEPMGFCLHNNVAVATSFLLNKKELGIKKILIVDWDVHHGNGTQKMFWKDPRVLFFSVHRYEFGSFYPASEDGSHIMIGEGPGAGYNINVPWEGGRCGDADYIAAWDHVLIPVAKEFTPDIIMISAGFDAAVGDPLGGCRVTPYGYSVMLKKLMEFAQGKIVMALEGGYNLDSLANSVLACVEVLVEDKPLTGSSEAYPFESTWRVIQEVREVLSPFWPTLKDELSKKFTHRKAPPIQGPPRRGCSMTQSSLFIAEPLAQSEPSIPIDQGEGAQMAQTVVHNEEDVPLADLPHGGVPQSKDASGSSTSTTLPSTIPQLASSDVAPSEGASKVDAASENEGVVPSPNKEQDRNAPDVGADKKDAADANVASSDVGKVDEFNAINIASNIAKEVVNEVREEDATKKAALDFLGGLRDIGDGGGDGAQKEMHEVEETDGLGKETETMNVEPAEEIESPVRSLGFEPPPFIASVAEGGVSSKKKKRLKKKLQVATTSSKGQTPSPPHAPLIIEVPSSTEKDTLTSKVAHGPSVSESSDMDDLGENSEEESEEENEDSHGKSSGDIFEGIGDIFPLPFFSSKEGFRTGGNASELTLSKLLASGHPTDSKLNLADDNRHEQLPKIQGTIVQHEGQNGVSSFVLPMYALLGDTEGNHLWRIKACSAPVLRALEKQYPQTFANCTAGRLVGGTLFDLLAKTIICLQKLKVKDLTDQKYEDIFSFIKDMEVFGINLGWLREYLEKVRSTKTLFASLFKVQTSATQLAEAKEKYEQLLAEAKQKISALEVSHELLVKEHQALEAAPKATLSDDEPIFPQTDLIAQKISE